MYEAVAEFLGQRRIGEMQTYRNLAVFPLIGGTTGFGEYLLLDEALEKGVVEIRERDPVGTVPVVLVSNRSSKPVLLLDGEELVGARQNRVLNSSILVAPRSECLVGVSCVEAGRWSNQSEGFASSGVQYNPLGRQRNSQEITLSLSEGGPPTPDQSRIWSDIDTLLADAAVDSRTAAMNDAYAMLEDDLNEYARSFSAVDGQTGMVFALDGEIIGLDAFDRPRTLAVLLPKLIRSYALDALVSGGKTCDVDPEAAEEFVHAAAAADYEVSPSHGMGRLLYTSSRHTAGLTLMVDLDVVHLSVFARPDGKCRKYNTRMSRLSRRRRARQGKGVFTDAV